MQKWRANVAMHIDKTAQKRIERDRERERKERRKLCHGERTHRQRHDTSRAAGGALAWQLVQKSGWRRRHVACDDGRGRKREVRGRHD